jgi:hypothetical protein
MLQHGCYYGGDPEDLGLLQDSLALEAMRVA